MIRFHANILYWLVCKIILQPLFFFNKYSKSSFSWNTWGMIVSRYLSTDKLLYFSPNSGNHLQNFSPQFCQQVSNKTKLVKFVYTNSKNYLFGSKKKWVQHFFCQNIIFLSKFIYFYIFWRQVKILILIENHEVFSFV